MKRRGTALKELIIWFNQLREEERDFILTCIENNWSVRFSNYILSSEDVQKYLSLVNIIVELIDQIADEGKIRKKLVLSGLEEKAASIFYDFCEACVEQKADAAIVRKMEEDSFDAAVKFIIEKMILYKEYQFMAPMYVSNLCKLQNMDEALKVLRFLYDKIAMISNRDVSRETLRSILEIDYLIPGNLIELFFRRIDTNYSELNQAHLIIRFNTLLNKVERFENFIEEMESKDSNKE